MREVVIMSGLPRMRTAAQCALYLKENDPECCIGEWTIRKMIAQKKFQIVRSGTRILINLDQLLNYLTNGEEVDNDGEA